MMKNNPNYPLPEDAVFPPNVGSGFSFDSSQALFRNPTATARHSSVRGARGGSRNTLARVRAQSRRAHVGCHRGEDDKLNTSALPRGTRKTRTRGSSLFINL